jgi:hypothetical protein
VSREFILIYRLVSAMADNETSSGRIPPEAVGLLSEPLSESTGSPPLATDPPTEGTANLAEAGRLQGAAEIPRGDEGAVASDSRHSGTTDGDEEVMKSDNDNDNDGDNDNDKYGDMLMPPPPPQTGVDRTLTKVALILNQSQRKP